MYSEHKKLYAAAAIILQAAASGMADSTGGPPKKRLRKENSFRLNAKNLFLTWPKNDADAGVVTNNLLEHFGADNVSYLCVSTEDHEDGTPHLHALVCLKNKVDIKNAATLDEIGGGKHGNYQSAKNVRNVLEYVKKGGNFVEHGTCPVKANETKCRMIASQLLEGADLDKVIETDPGFALLHLRAIMMFKHQVDQMKMKKREKPSPLSYSFYGHMIEIGFSREFKQKQYWIWGGPNTGKTSFINDLGVHGFLGYQIPTNDDHVEWENGTYDFAYIDEFHGQLSITFLNQFLQGSLLKMNVKGRSAIKRENIPVFILSNFPPDRAWKNISDVSLNALLSRLHIIFTG